MKLDRKWLLLPPAAALLICLGPLTMASGRNGNPQKNAPATAAARTAQDARTDKGTDKGNGQLAPRTPDLWQLGSTLIGVLLLGAAGVFLVRRARGGRPKTTGSGACALRQTLRLGAKQALHVVEFDDQLLLLGHGDHGFAVLHHVRSPERALDEATLAARSVADGDDGAVPKDLLIPRPARPQRPPVTPPSPPRRSGVLNDFRTLLHKAGKA
ncbi:MAG TPA: flagellar biosynthetic protein FliO [Planctomycetota bacterium]|nr:flagellar biosynthetic protein FliO [Planctomycetota bacterium]